ncbi:hypothetical protein BDK51DRAFT_50821 [Blyttiomyces helicus]|uniref:Uncharacterized protein n=1 Tax=Blyttiomyces helicus TaxID=388810 RepID=A0A4P9W0F2_9FUNG|nr:hypothetical protein BDK51DRAFT_50821 [Blyttiomyces helicus]|eukprot:RKO85112.1 hypothetical protein BDK51DRAFT_50821 [Blyttiomyces helicus]
MSKQTGSGKDLKGAPNSGAGSFNIRDLLAALQNSRLSLVNVTLENATIYSGQMDDVVIGSISPSPSTFTQTTIGSNGSGGPFIAYGDTPTIYQYDSNGNIIAGSLTVTDGSILGNIQIIDNKIIAVPQNLNHTGNIEMIPETSSNYIWIGGNIQQNNTGVVEFNMASDFSITSLSTANVNARTDFNMTSDRGNITLETDDKSVNEIESIEYIQTTSLATSVSVTLADSSIQTTTNNFLQVITAGDNMVTTETDDLNGVVFQIIETVQSKSTVLGIPQTVTTITTTEIVPANVLTQAETFTTISGPTTTIDSQVPILFIPLEGGTTVNTAVFTTQAVNGYAVGDPIVITGTDSVPSLDGSYEVYKIISPTVFAVLASTPFTTGSEGTITMTKVGTLNLHGGVEVNFDNGVPLCFGNSAIVDRPYIESEDTNDLTISSTYINLHDPIVTLSTATSLFSDSGIAVEYKVNSILQHGFFGFVTSTSNFTWIPFATITLNNDGTKTVSGSKGIMDLQGVQLQQIIGDPDINFDAPSGGVNFNTSEPVNFSSSIAFNNGAQPVSLVL